MRKPALGFWQIWNISFGFFGIQIGFALQGANISRIFQTLGAPIDTLAILWLAGPVTGLLVQPLVGHFSDKTWGRLGRRRPFFLVGAILTTLSLFIMPHSPSLWVAAIMLWVLDASINISMEPFRAFVGDMLPSRQRTRGFAMQTIFIGTGALLASMAPWVLANWFSVSSEAPAGIIPDAVKYSFYLGGIVLFLAVGWTVVSTREYSPRQLVEFANASNNELARETALARPVRYFVRAGVSFLLAGLLASLAVFYFNAAATLYVLSGGVAAFGGFLLLQSLLQHTGKTSNFFSEIIRDMTSMPLVMKRLAWVQFFSWLAMFVMWVYGTPAVTSHHFGTSDPTSMLYNEGANWLGMLFAAYNGVAAVWAFALPVLARACNRRTAHGISLLAGGIALASFFIIKNPALLWLPMIGVGMAWASILTMPYAILSDALSSQKMGIYMGIFNFFIVIPQIVVAGVMGPVLTGLLGGQAILTFLIAGASLVLAAACLLRVPAQPILGENEPQAD